MVAIARARSIFNFSHSSAEEPPWRIGFVSRLLSPVGLTNSNALASPMSFRRLVRQYWRSGPYILPDGVLHLMSSDRSATIRFSLAFILELIDTSHFGRQQTPIFLRSIEVGQPG